MKICNYKYPNIWKVVVVKSGWNDYYINSVKQDDANDVVSLRTKAKDVK